MRIAFLDHYLKGTENGVEDWPAIRFWNLGEEAFHETEVWPPAGTVPTSFYLNQGGMLSEESSAGPGGVDRYLVDAGVTTGETNRWTTQMGGPVYGLDDRAAMDERMLTIRECADSVALFVHALGDLGQQSLVIVDRYHAERSGN